MDKNYKIGIIGYGVVGKGIHRLFKEDVKAIYDITFPVGMWHKGDITDGSIVLEKAPTDIYIGDQGSFRGLDLVVISVPTNELPDGSCDTSIVTDSLRWLYEIGYTGRILIKSTVPPSFFDNLNPFGNRVVFSPEFQGESKYFTPEWKYPHPEKMESHTWQVFGGNSEDTTICVDIFKRRMGVDCQFMQTDIKTASLAKYIENSFFAMKVTFVNEWFDIAKSYNVDWNVLRELWLLDPRINRNHTLVFPKDRGYGGKCFPKDTKAIIKDLEGKYEPKLMKAMDQVNNEMRTKNV